MILHIIPAVIYVRHKRIRLRRLSGPPFPGDVLESLAMRRPTLAEGSAFPLLRPIVCAAWRIRDPTHAHSTWLRHPVRRRRAGGDGRDVERASEQEARPART